jgi:hypothetical protein
MSIRTTAAATTATLLLVGLTACAGTTSSPESSAPAKDDVRIVGCFVDNILNLPSASVLITNHSGKSSNYMVRVEFLDSSGTRVAEGIAAKNNLDAGKYSAQIAHGGLKTVTAPITCRVLDVTRHVAP